MFKEVLLAKKYDTRWKLGSIQSNSKLWKCYVKYVRRYNFSS